MIGAVHRSPLAAAAVLAGVLAWDSPALAADLARQDGWAEMVSDRAAARVGDSLTVLIYESASASNSAVTGAKKNSLLGGRLRVSDEDESAELSLNSRYDGAGESGRSDKMVAQMSVVVVEVLPNGDLRIAGEQNRAVNGQQTRIRVQGRARPSDISSANTILSSRLADAVIEYDGQGFVTRAARPGLLSRMIHGLGIF
ncbi:MAG TPA: flagellar basal body L-ring protein FlgH [Phenylobacterium sp.]